jgi:1-acyl-sn-glycerol-3-phosphate acyltransferase
MQTTLSLPMGTRPFLRPLIWLYETVSFYGVLAAFGVLFLGWNLAASLLYHVMPLKRSRKVGQIAIMCIFRTLLGLMRATGLVTFDLGALDALRAEPGLVIAANHPTLIDAVLVISRLPSAVCIAKASLWSNPALGAGARMAGYIQNDASPGRLVRNAADAVRQGSQLLIFPEGTRSGPEGMHAFKAGFALIARQAGAPVQTVILQASSPYLTKGWPLTRRPLLPLHFTAHLGERFEPDARSVCLSERVESHIRGQLASQVGILRS